jgi:hypothetical protein
LDALLLHHPWHIDLENLPQMWGCWLTIEFDEGLTLGFNPILANGLHLTALEVLGMKHDRPIGMIGNIPPRTWQI